MRLLIISDAWEPQVNGVVRTYQNIGKALRAMGHTVEVIGPDKFAGFPMPGYSEIQLSLFPASRLKRLIEAYAPDSIHIPVEGPLGWAARRYCIRNGIAFTTSFHTQFPDYIASRVKFLGARGMDLVKKLGIAYVRRFHAPAKATFVATQSLEDQLRAWNFVQPMVRLLRGVDFSVFYPGDKTFFSGYERPIQLYVGRVSVEKNIEAFLDLKNPGTKVVVGDGPALAALRTRYPGVVFTGTKLGKDLGDHFRSSDVFVFPSKTDTFGMVLTEAMACGLPVAGYDVTGPRDIINMPMLGCVGDDLAASVAGALQAPGDAEERYAFCTAHYSWDAVARVFLETAQRKA